MERIEIYKHQPEPITEAKKGKIFVDIAILTDRKINNNRLDIMLKDYEIKTCLQNDMSMPTDNNISKIRAPVKTGVK